MHVGAFIYIRALTHFDTTHMKLHTCSRTQRGGKKQNAGTLYTFAAAHLMQQKRGEVEQENILINNSALTPWCAHSPTVLHVHVNRHMCGYADTCIHTHRESVSSAYIHTLSFTLPHSLYLFSLSLYTYTHACLIAVRLHSTAQSCVRVYKV